MPYYDEYVVRVILLPESQSGDDLGGSYKMIFVFSGTGNSLYLAEELSRYLGDEIINLNHQLKTDSQPNLQEADRLIVVMPTYAWRIPRIASDYLKALTFPPKLKTYFVLNCGDRIGNAAYYNEKLCQELGLDYMGTKKVVMPENFLAMFAIPSEERADRIIRQATRRIGQVAEEISTGQSFSPQQAGLVDKAMSGVVNSLFYTFIVSGRRFTVDDSCVSCERCTEICPLNNISMVEGKPVWGKNCTFCMACIAHCPTEAIEAGLSKGKRRYTFPKQGEEVNKSPC